MLQIFNFCKCSLILGWTLMIQMSFSHFCSCKYLLAYTSVSNNSLVHFGWAFMVFVLWYIVGFLSMVSRHVLNLPRKQTSVIQYSKTTWTIEVVLSVLPEFQSKCSLLKTLYTSHIWRNRVVTDLEASSLWNGPYSIIRFPGNYQGREENNSPTLLQQLQNPAMTGWAKYS